jgi:hypothetical protein
VTPPDSAGTGRATAAGQGRATSPVSYTGEAGLPAVTDEMLRDALQGIRPYTVYILKAPRAIRNPARHARARWRI